jgi:hypothetical protein
MGRQFAITIKVFFSQSICRIYLCGPNYNFWTIFGWFKH